jgi:aminoglycoside 3-N-acetyltransferase I
MPSPQPFAVRQLSADDLPVMHALLTVFGEAFEDVPTYSAKRPSDRYLRELLESRTFVAVAALEDDEVIGGLAAYELRKFEQERSEIYIYDLAVALPHRRRGVATAVIGELQRIAAERGAWVVYVQADLVDAPAVALYTKLGIREDVLHFDLPVPAR